MKLKLLAGIAFSIFLTSCSHSKIYKSCDDMTSSLKGEKYDDLVKDWGEPYYKDEYAAGGTFYVKWAGVGVDGKDAKFYFDELVTSWGSSLPDEVKGVECDPIPDGK